MKFFDSKKILSVFKQKPRGKTDYRDPYAAWFWILISTAIIFIVIIAADGFLFFKISTGQIFVEKDTTASTAPTVNRTALESANKIYESKETEFNALQAAPQTQIDPSE